MKIPEYLKEEIKEIVKEAVKEQIREISSEKKIKNEDTAEYLTRNQAAEFLKCSLVTLYNYQRKSLLPYYQVGRKIFFMKSELLKMMKVDLNVGRIKK